MNYRNSARAVLLLAVASALAAPRSVRPGALRDSQLRALLIPAGQCTAERIQAAKDQGDNAIVLAIDNASGIDADDEGAAAGRILKSGLALYYWIEVARNEPLAREHPEWMASLQGHDQWRRLFDDPPQPKAGQVVKVYPWVPILYQEAFDAQLARIMRLLQGKPAATGIFLNDLQGAPSACGCGNPLCRWTTDYGPIKTATPLGNNAPARFVSAVGRLVPGATVIPVWTTECEQRDGAEDGRCAGVGCFNGICWRAYTQQLMPVARSNDRLAILLPLHDFKRDVDDYGRPAGWIAHALQSFQTMPPRHGGAAIAADRLIAVVQGWDVSRAQIGQQQQRAAEAGAGGIVVSAMKIDQSWQPRVVSYNKASQ